MFKSLSSVAIFALLCLPASAAVVGGGNIDLSAGPFTFGPDPNNAFILSYSTGGDPFNPSPVFIATTGTAAVSSVFGAPSVYFTDGRGGDVVFPDSAATFASYPTAANIAYSASDSFLGLAYSVNSNTYYGFAEFAGPDLEKYAFETVANMPIDANAVAAGTPEPSTWAMLLIGVAGLGLAASRRSRKRADPATA